MNITIKGVTKEDTAYDKNITFEREGVEYSVLLHWDSYDGYDLQFLDGKKFIADPEWVSEWQEKAEEENTEYLEDALDGLTDEVIEGGE
jgi:hypothetical protein